MVEGDRVPDGYRPGVCMRRISCRVRQLFGTSGFERRVLRRGKPFADDVAAHRDEIESRLKGFKSVGAAVCPGGKTSIPSGMKVPQLRAHRSGSGRRDQVNKGVRWMSRR